MPIVTLTQILDRREQRSAYQKELIKRYGCAIVSFMVNMPGPVKVTSLTKKVHKAGMSALLAALPQDKICFSEVLFLQTGFEGYTAVNLPAEELKRITVELENSLSYGRLLDFDVFDKTQAQISRTQLGFAPRACIVCGKKGAACASRRLHELPEIIAAFERLAKLA